ncbi:hypothetical protein [Formosa haliotis]|uniref:hypothetical protein n=1 Tax=Formosa haliotis TaxID=1555194 RepID=UPI0009F425E4|nr:hypothetical protein [Formosa haliotis]
MSIPTYSSFSNLAAAPLLVGKQFVIGLSITFLFFFVLLIFVIRKTYKLKAENERLANLNIDIDEDKKEYQDFTEGHLYTKE